MGSTFCPRSPLPGRWAPVPIRVDQYYTTNWWGGIGVNMNIPIFNGFLYGAEAKEARYRAQADAERTRDLRDRIVRDVRTAWLQANTAYQRIEVRPNCSSKPTWRFNWHRHAISWGLAPSLSSARHNCNRPARPLTIPTLNMSIACRWRRSIIRSGRRHDDKIRASHISKARCPEFPVPSSGQVRVLCAFH
jgi:hypothetical protein